MPLFRTTGSAGRSTEGGLAGVWSSFEYVASSLNGRLRGGFPVDGSTTGLEWPITSLLQQPPEPP
jgi:hypothetical protein